MFDLISATIWNRDRMFDCWKQHYLRNFADMAFYAFFKIGYRCDETMVDLGLEVSSKPLATRLQVRRSRIPCCRKMGCTRFTQQAMWHAPSPVNDTLHCWTNQLFRLFRQDDVIIVFMQDSASPHIDHCMKQSLCRHFGDNRIISRQFPTAWPSKFPRLDITKLEIFLDISFDYSIKTYSTVWIILRFTTSL